MSATKDQANQVSFVLRYALQSFGVILILGVLIRTFLFSSYVMSGSSMLPSVWPGDFIVASKWGLHDLRRGQVVALRCPQEKLCLKRVLGLPGDRVEIRDDGVLINGARSWVSAIGPIRVESVSGKHWTILVDGKPQLMAPVVVPPHKLFVANDKRSDLDDSRSWGPVSEDLIEAKVRFAWLSLDWFDVGVAEASAGTEQAHKRNWPRVRWNRLFRRLD